MAFEININKKFKYSEDKIKPIATGNSAGSSYIHPNYTALNPTLSGALVIDTITTDTIGSVLDITTRTLTPADISSLPNEVTILTGTPDYNSISPNLGHLFVPTGTSNSPVGAATGFFSFTMLQAIDNDNNGFQLAVSTFSGGLFIRSRNSGSFGSWNEYATKEYINNEFTTKFTELTINGVTQDLSANRTWDVGTVTSVAMSVPTGLTVSGSPITSSGTLAVSLEAGYSIPLITKQTEWNTAYTNRITSLTTTGNSGVATLISNVLNIPEYTLAGLGGIGGTIVAGQVAFGTGANTIGGDSKLIFNNTTGLLTLNGDLQFIGAQTIQTNTGDLTLATGAGNGNIILSPNGTGRIYVLKNIDSTLDTLYNSESNSNITIQSSTTNGTARLLVGVDNTNDLSYIQSMQRGIGWDKLLLLQGMGGNVLIGTYSGSGGATAKLDINGNLKVRGISNLGTTATEVLVPSATGVVSKRTLAEFKTDLGLAGNYVTLNTVQTITGVKSFINEISLKRSYGNISIGFFEEDTTTRTFGIYQSASTGLRFIRYGGTLGGSNPSLLYLDRTTDFIGVNTVPSERLDVNGNIRVRSLTTTEGDFVQTDATGVFQRRTAAQVLSQIGAQPTIVGTATEGYITTVVGGVATWATIDSHTHNASQITSGTFGSGNFIFPSNLKITGQVAGGFVNKANRIGLTDIDWNAGNTQKIVLIGDVTLTFSNAVIGTSYQLIIVQDATGGRTITWPAVEWAGKTVPTLTGTAGSKDVITLIYEVSSTYIGVISKNHGV